MAVPAFPMKTGLDRADCLLYMDQSAVGVIEAKSVGLLSGVEIQSAKCAAGLRDDPPTAHRSLLFLFQSNLDVRWFTKGLGPNPRPRQAFRHPRPGTLGELAKRLEQLLSPASRVLATRRTTTALDAPDARRPPAGILRSVGETARPHADGDGVRPDVRSGLHRVRMGQGRGRPAHPRSGGPSQPRNPDEERVRQLHVSRRSPKLLPSKVEHLTTNVVHVTGRVLIATVQSRYPLPRGAEELTTPCGIVVPNRRP